VSGSVEEIEKHIEAGKPAMIYFSSAPVRLDSVDEAQYNALKEFKGQLKDRGLYDTYDTPGDFADKFRRQLATRINNDLFFHVEGAGADREALVNEIISEAVKKIPGMSDEAKTLLTEASLDRNGQVLSMKLMGGEIIQTNGKSFTGEDARTKAIWNGALRELVSLGLLESVGYKNQIFNVTREGYDVAEMLRP
jgi:hypothetical protein